MKYDEFMTAMKQYYGKYALPATEAMTRRYLEDEFLEEELPALAETVFRTFSGQYKCTPDIAVIESAKEVYNRNVYGGDKMIGKQREPEYKYLPAPVRNRKEMMKVGDLAKDLVDRLNNMGGKDE